VHVKERRNLVRPHRIGKRGLAPHVSL